jgi:hypothetical protein
MNINNETISFENKKTKVSKTIDINLLNNNFNYVTDYATNPTKYTVYIDSATSYHLAKTSGLSNIQFNPNFIFEYNGQIFINMNSNLYTLDSNNKLVLNKSSFGTIKNSYYIKETGDVLLFIGNNLYSMNKSQNIANNVNEVCEIKIIKDITYIFYNVIDSDKFVICIPKSSAYSLIEISGKYLCIYHYNSNDKILINLVEKRPGKNGLYQTFHLTDSSNDVILIGSTQGLYCMKHNDNSYEPYGPLVSGNIDIIKERKLDNDTSIYAIDKSNHKIYKIYKEITDKKPGGGLVVYMPSTEAEATDTNTYYILKAEEFEKSSVKYKNFDVVNPIKDFINTSETDENDEIRYKGRRKLFTNMN